jgi:hypothetical protein
MTKVKLQRTALKNRRKYIWIKSTPSQKTQSSQSSKAQLLCLRLGQLSKGTKLIRANVRRQELAHAPCFALKQEKQTYSLARIATEDKMSTINNVTQI